MQPTLLQQHEKPLLLTLFGGKNHHEVSDVNTQAISMHAWGELAPGWEGGFVPPLTNYWGVLWHGKFTTRTAYHQPHCCSSLAKKCGRRWSALFSRNDFKRTWMSTIAKPDGLQMLAKELAAEVNTASKQSEADLISRLKLFHRDVNTHAVSNLESSRSIGL